MLESNSNKSFDNASIDQKGSVVMQGEEEEQEDEMGTSFEGEIEDDYGEEETPDNQKIHFH